MLRIIETFMNVPNYYEFDQADNFQSGQIGSLRIKKGKTIVGVCDGLNPRGIIDDVKTNKLRGVVWGERLNVLIKDFIYDTDHKSISSRDHAVQLSHKNVIASSFRSSIPVQLNAKKGTITISKGTTFNVPGGFNININYAYNILSKKIEDSTIGSNRIIVWSKNMIAETDMFDTTQLYPKYSTLYVSQGLLTTQRWTPECKSIGSVLYPPTSEHPYLQFLFDLDGNIEFGYL